MTIERYRHRRTTGSGPPPDLLWGEIAYSDADEKIHVGRPNGTAKSFSLNPAPLAHGHLWADIADPPDAYPPADHGHPYAPLPTVGDWSPAYEFSGSGSVVMAAFSAGRWRKTGNWVEFQLRVGTASLAAPSGEIWITLPPFPADLSPVTWGWPCAIGPRALWAVDMPLSAIVNLKNHIRLYANAVTANYAIVQATALSAAANGNQIFMAGAYRTV